MGAWELYESRHDVTGHRIREAKLTYAREAYARRMQDSLSYRHVTIDGVDQDVVIVHSADMNIKKIFSIPGEHLEHGGLVDFADNKWLITEMDPDNLIYDKGLMQQCNHILRWIGKDGTVKEKWCIVEDGTKYLAGEKRREMLTIGEARIAVTVAKDDDTVELWRGLRFLIDDADADDVLAYEITKPNKLFNIYNGKGVYRFILSECNLTSDDNKEQRIADYTKWFPDMPHDGDHRDSEYTVAEIVEAAREEAAKPPDDDKEVWL